MIANLPQLLPEHRPALNARQTLILVEPVAGGWCVSCRGAFESLVFLSGGRAETQARALARSLAVLGQGAVVEIHDRENGLAGAARYPARGTEPFVEGVSI
jgi:hypothetical protein